MTADPGSRRYTVEEADALLPDLEDRLRRIRASRQVLLRSARLVRDAVEDDGGGVAGPPEYWEAQATLRAEVERLAEESIVLRDAETGLVDFPGERDGRTVWLCWRLGEERVAHWHELDAGFASRRPL